MKKITKILETAMIITDAIIFIGALGLTVYFAWADNIEMATFTLLFAMFIKLGYKKTTIVENFNDYGTKGACTCNEPDLTGMKVEGNVKVQMKGYKKGSKGRIYKDETNPLTKH